MLYNFAWSEVFDWYLEMAKPGLRDEARAATTRTTLGVVLRDLLAMFHPVIPFITEELWSELGDGSMLIAGSWPVPPKEAAPDGIGELIELVTGVRRFRAEHQLGRKPLPVHLVDSGGVDSGGVAVPWWTDQLTGLAAVTVETTAPPADISGHTRIDAGRVSLFVPLTGLVDVAAERPRLEKALAEAETELARSQAKLGKPDFRDRAPAAVVAKEEAKTVEFGAAIDKLRAQIARLGS
jgi:valyl-tRNA synthetase